MDSKNFFEDQIELLHCLGIRFEYPKGFKGFALKSVAALLAIAIFAWIFAEVNFLINNITDLKNNAETFAICVTASYSLIQFIVMFKKRREFGKFLAKLNDYIQHLEQSRGSFGVTDKPRKWLRFATKVRHGLGVGAGTGLFVKAILKCIVTGKRYLPANLEYVIF